MKKLGWIYNLLRILGYLRIKGGIINYNRIRNYDYDCFRYIGCMVILVMI